VHARTRASKWCRAARNEKRERKKESERERKFCDQRVRCDDSRFPNSQLEIAVVERLKTTHPVMFGVDNNR
jgi:hypothetical protein